MPNEHVKTGPLKPGSAHETGRYANTQPQIETYGPMTMPAAAGAAYNFSGNGNFLVLTSATGTITAKIKGTSSSFNVPVGRVFMFDDPFGIPMTIEFYSTVGNDAITFDFGYGKELTFDIAPGSATSPAVIVTNDEGSASIAIANNTNQNFSFVNEVPFTQVTFGTFVVAAGNVTFIGFSRKGGNAVTLPVYDVYGKQVSDANGVVQAAQMKQLVFEGSNSAGVLNIDTSGLSLLQIQNNGTGTSITFSVSASHLPSSLFIGQTKSYPTYRSCTGTLQAAAVARFWNLTPPVGGIPTGGHLYLVRVLLSISATASSAGRTIRLLRCNTLDTGGTSTSFPGFGHDPLRTGLGTAKLYTVAQTTLGTINDQIDNQWLTVPANANLTSPNVIFDFRQNVEKPHIPFSSGSTWQFALDIDAAQAGQVAIVTAEYEIR